MKTMDDNLVRLLEAWPCCTLATVRIVDLPERERSFFAHFMPAARTAVVLGHHISIEEEWTWYATETGGEHCTADDHARGLCEIIKAELIQSGHETEIVNYPGTSGLQFRFVAEAAGLGAIGLIAFLFHPAWGPWVHSRVVATTAILDIHPTMSGDQLCNQCMLCMTECPAGAISDGAFSGLQCRIYRKSRGEYEPYGPNGEFRYCMRCAWVCPRGQRPLERYKRGEGEQ
ncbi:Epoxyqueuosine reductase [uncultured archaeon]|nr:Epoxyqueuosine reductase [uncultured archaeon]